MSTVSPRHTPKVSPEASIYLVTPSEPDAVYYVHSRAAAERTQLPFKQIPHASTLGVT